VIDEGKINELRLVDSYQQAKQNTAVNAQETFVRIPPKPLHNVFLFLKSAEQIEGFNCA
jgi:hypothetical protein